MMNEENMKLMKEETEHLNAVNSYVEMTMLDSLSGNLNVALTLDDSIYKDTLNWGVLAEWAELSQYFREKQYISNADPEVVFKQLTTAERKTLVCQGPGSSVIVLSNEPRENRLCVTLPTQFTMVRHSVESFRITQWNICDIDAGWKLSFTVEPESSLRIGGVSLSWSIMVIPGPGKPEARSITAAENTTYSISRNECGLMAMKVNLPSLLTIFTDGSNTVNSSEFLMDIRIGAKSKEALPGRCGRKSISRVTSTLPSGIAQDLLPHLNEESPESSSLERKEYDLPPMSPNSQIMECLPTQCGLGNCKCHPEIIFSEDEDETESEFESDL